MFVAVVRQARAAVAAGAKRISDQIELNGSRGGRMAKLRHIAVHTPDPEKTAEFYKRVFDMKEVGRTDSPIAK
jgi:hypothetical protein